MCASIRHFDLCRCPARTSGLDAGPEAYHNPAAVWWGAFAVSVVILTGGPTRLVTVRMPISAVAGTTNGGC